MAAAWKTTTAGGALFSDGSVFFVKTFSRNFSWKWFHEKCVGFYDIPGIIRKIGNNIKVEQWFSTFFATFLAKEKIEDMP